MATPQHIRITHRWLKKNLPNLSGSAVRVYLALRIFADGKTGECWPSAKRIGELTGLSRWQIYRAVDELKGFHLVAVEGRGKMHSNRYFVDVAYM